MSFSIQRIESLQPTDNLLIISTSTDLLWTGKYLTASEQAYLTHAAKQAINYVFFPKETQGILVHFVGVRDNAIDQKEANRRAGNEIISAITHYRIDTLTILNKSGQNHLAEYVEGMVLGGYQFTKYLSGNDQTFRGAKTINVLGTAISPLVLEELEAVLHATYKARDLVNEPQSYLTAVKLGEEIEALGKQYGFQVETLNKAKIQALKMGGLLAVNKGSFAPPRFSVLEWKHPAAKNTKPIVLVGKGVVFDTGGINLKPTQGSLDMMKCDMAGAATVIGAMVAVAKAKLPIHLIALVPATDNRLGNDAYLPGDVITMYDGTTVEVLNTDAEGRLILADALHYAKKYDPELVLDFATLTGAAVRSLGQHAICYMGTADKMVKTNLENSGEQVYERLVEFPLWKEYGNALRSNVADLKNIGGPTAGQITAGKFLQHFTDYPWLHFDIAGPAFLRAADSYRTKEGTGVGVRLIFDFLRNY
ncbi:MAG: M17 family metallopeptidase [Saprospiraceae bacterium]